MTTLDDNLRRIDELAKLKVNWDCYGAVPPKPVALDLARMAVTKLAMLSVPVDSIGADPDGDVSIGIDEDVMAELCCCTSGTFLFSAMADSGEAITVELPGTVIGVLQALAHYALYRVKHNV